jgi:para-aminobenzoate synthetase component 1
VRRGPNGCSPYHRRVTASSLPAAGRTERAAALVLLPLPELADRHPADVADAFRDLPNLALLESARHGAAARWSFLSADPLEILQIDGPSTGSNGLERARRLLARMDATEPGRGGDVPPPFLGGLIGYFGYAFGAALERRARSRHAPTAMPDLWFGLYDWVIAWDHRTARAWLGGRAVDGDRERLRRRIEDVRQRVAALGHPAKRAPSASARPILPFTSSLERDDYEATVGRVRAAIADGDIYQANLTRRLATSFRDDPWPLYRQLRDGDPAVNAAYLGLGRGVETDQAGAAAVGPRAIVSASPEGFVALDSDGRVTTRPIKGTRPRGQDRDEDRRFACDLLASAKDRAENVMIVDVVRNDLGRVCRPGTVTVPRLCRLERTDAVQHLVSTITGRLRPDADAFGLLGATFPGGSITGAPKVRAMELIDAFEPVARGPYTGTLGWIGADGAMATSMLIRTFVADGSTLSLHVGGGITWRSDPAAEWDETVAKARGPLRAIGGVEIESGWGRRAAPDEPNAAAGDQASADDESLARIPVAVGGPGWWRR